MRVVLNKRMLHPRDSAQYCGVINEVVTDFIKGIKQLRQASPTEDLVPDISNRFYLFSLEGIASILFEKRLGCLRNEIPAGTEEFINSIAQMFSNSMPVAIFPKWSRNLLPYWGRYIASWDGIFSFSELLKLYTEVPLTQTPKPEVAVPWETTTKLACNSFRHECTFKKKKKRPLTFHWFDNILQNLDRWKCLTFFKTFKTELLTL
ncbi:hypothetical protein ILYODFUR_020713 [Ilyodon furcidens]|uniref:Uncharacterized protein n=1 Tax=Ilyodon furcidens TaxID=33524 RepID=A0ABV0TWA0_9TELE